MGHVYMGVLRPREVPMQACWAATNRKEETEFKSTSTRTLALYQHLILMELLSVLSNATKTSNLLPM